jgi:uncharacterized protein YabN with tetrapyrrole methylase and pyrophosphatase domain
MCKFFDDHIHTCYEIVFGDLATKVVGNAKNPTISSVVPGHA